jgi:hypothetical protein
MLGPRGDESGLAITTEMCCGFPPLLRDRASSGLMKSEDVAICSAPTRTSSNLVA